MRATEPVFIKAGPRLPLAQAPLYALHVQYASRTLRAVYAQLGILSRAARVRCGQQRALNTRAFKVTKPFARTPRV